MSHGLTLTRRDNDRRIVLAVAGEVDLATTPQLRSAIQAVFDSGVRELRLDLSGTTFMDSSGLHALFDSHARAEQLDARMEIVCPPGPVRRLFEIVGYSERLPLRDAPDE